MSMLETSEDISTSTITYVLRRGDELHRVVMNLKYETLEWYFMDYEKDIELRGHREKNDIILTGRKGSTPIEIQHVVNFDPWYQVMEPSIHYFSQSPRKEQAFWIVDPESLQVHRMMAGNKTLLSVKTEDAVVDTLQITVTFASSMSVMWQGNFWYRVDDGSFFNYEAIASSPLIQPVRITPLMK